MFSINLRAFTWLVSLGLGLCVMASGCFSCTEERTVQPSGVVVQPGPATVVVPNPPPSSSTATTTTTP